VLKPRKGQLIQALLSLGRKAQEYHRNGVTHMPIAVTGYDYAGAMHLPIVRRRDQVETHFFPNWERFQGRKLNPIFSDTN
jgi:hypothetical protein